MSEVRVLIQNDELKVSFKDSRELRDAVFEKLLSYYVKHEAFNGEVIMQSDNPQIYAAPLLSDIADELIKFDTEWS